MSFIHYCSTSDKSITAKEIGGKAYSLYVLGQANKSLNIPQWFAVKENTKAKIEENEALKMQFKQELNEALKSFGMNKLWAVRSSASSEDSLQNSFAGQLDTFLYVPADKVEETIEKVWKSIYSEHFIQYTKERNIDVLESPAVLIQLMVNAESAGVGFGINPVTQDKEYVVSSVYGLGNQLVSGDTDADTWIVKNGKIDDVVIAFKEKKEVLDQTNFGTILVDIIEPESPSLTDVQVLKVQELIKAVSDYYGHPQDIEWAIESGQVFLLQSRPITTINEGKEILWDNSNIAESYGGITTPLTFSFAKKAYENVYRQLCLILNISKTKVDNHDVEFRNMLGLVQGRVFYNMNSWYKTLALLPGFSLNKTFMEQMMGVKEELSDELVQEIQQNVTKNKFKDGINLATTSLGLVKSLALLDMTVNDFYKRLDVALAPRDLSKMSASELMQYYNSLELQLLKKWDAPMVNDLFAMVFYGLLRKLSTNWCNDHDESLQNTLILTQGGIISAEPAKLMKQMARKIHGYQMGELAFAQWCEQVDKTDVKKDIDSYIDRFGDRCLDELKLESITLFDNPVLLYQTLFELSQNDLLMNTEEKVETDDKAKEMERDVLAKLPFAKRHTFAWIIKMARKTVRERENLRFERTRLFGRVRKIFLEIGRKLVVENILKDERDIFYLEVGEIQSFIEGTSTLTNLKALAELRKEEFERYENEAAPSDRFTTYGMVYKNNRYMSRSKNIVLEGDTQQGLGCCPGIVRGKVRVVRDPKNVTLEKGTILVAERTDPGWIMLFSSVSAILVERGSLLSHAAIVSRELNLPAVVSVPGLMDWLKDDDIVEMNGTTGTITKITE
jgi:phosphohistidine swiveling domain-containing protein